VVKIREEKRKKLPGKRIYMDGNATQNLCLFGCCDYDGNMKTSTRIGYFSFSLSLSHRQKVFFLFFFKVLLIRKLETEHVFIEREVDDDRKKTKEFLLFSSRTTEITNG